MSLVRFRPKFRSVPFFGLLLFVFSVGFPPFDDVTEVDLTLHMLQHVLVVFAGAMIAYPIFKNRLAKAEQVGLRPKMGLIAAALLIVFWHFPGPWDDAVLNPGIHVIEHLSFLLVGLLRGWWLLLLSDSGKIGALLAAIFGHMGYAVALILPSKIPVYSLYPIPDQIVLGWVHPSLLMKAIFLRLVDLRDESCSPCWMLETLRQ